MGLTHELDFQAGPLALRAFPDHTHSDERRPWAVARSVLSSVNRWQNAARLWACTHFSGSPDILSARWAWLYGGLLAVISAVLLFTGANHPLLDPVEGRQAEISREMLARPDFVVPHLGGARYYEKPPLQYWLTAAIFRLWGVHNWTARLVPACAAFLTVMIVYAWASRSLGTRPAFFGALILCLMPGYLLAGRTVILDSLLTSCVVSSWFAAQRAIEKTPVRYGWWILSSAMCGLGILAKGPVALALLVPPILAYRWLAPEASRPGLRLWSVYFLGAGLIATPWYALIAWRQPDFPVEFFWRSHVLRYVSPYTHEHAWWFYFPVLLALSFPWCFLFPALGLFLGKREQAMASLRPRGLGFCVLALAWCLMFYGVAGCKSPFYLTPALVPLALASGACADALMKANTALASRIWNHGRLVLARHLTTALLLLSVCGYPATAAMGLQRWTTALIHSLAAIAALLLWYRFSKRASPGVSWCACALAAMAFNLTLVQDVITGLAYQRTPTQVAKLLTRLPQFANSYVMGYGSVMPSAWFYLRSDNISFIPEEATSSFASLARQNRRLVVIVRRGEELERMIRQLPADRIEEVYRPKGRSRLALFVVRAPGT